MVFATKPPQDAVARLEWEDSCDRCGKFVPDGTGEQQATPLTKGNVTLAFSWTLCDECVAYFKKESA